MTAEELWATKYAHRHAEQRALEDARREQAFLDLPILVAGEPLRPMTPLDLLLLNGAESPFVCPRPVEPGDVALFYWVLHFDNDGTHGWRNNRRKSRLLARLANLPVEPLIVGAREYVEEIFLDAPTSSKERGDEKRPLGTCFLAPLVVGVALETGWSQDEILRTPLPRLFQYFKAIRARQEGKDFVDTSPSDALTGEFLSELNAISNAQN